MDKPTQREIAEKALVFLRRADVQRVTGLPTSTLYDMIKRDEFPRPVKITEGGRVGWIESEVIAWQKAKIAAREQVA